MMERHEVLSFQNQIETFKHAKHAIFVIFIGATNHWLTFTVHKTNENLQFYLFDSSPRCLEQLDCKDSDIPACYHKFLVEIHELQLKAYNKF